jgi:hypothetical protein
MVNPFTWTLGMLPSPFLAYHLANSSNAAVLPVHFTTWQYRKHYSQDTPFDVPPQAMPGAET